MSLFVWLFSALMAVAAAQDEKAAFDAAVKLMAARYPSAFSSGDFYRAAIAGMAAQADRLERTRGSALLTEAEYVAVQAGLRGERAGAGLDFHLINGQGLLVTRVHANSPASKVDIDPGDVVVGINGQPFVGMDRLKMSLLLDQLDADQLHLELRRGEALRSVDLVRGPFKLSPVDRCLLDDVDAPCIELRHFGDGAAEGLARALAGLDGDGLVIDLRGTSVGRPEEAVAAASLFMDAGQVVLMRDRPDGGLLPLSSAGGRTWTGRLVLVVDDSTAGLGEAFAAALREQVRATLVGTRSAGLGALDSYYPLGSGLVLRLADEPLRSPTGRSWAGQGLAPDVYVEHPDVVMPGSSGAPMADLQLEAAIRLIRAR